MEGIRTVPAIKAQFDAKSMEKLIQISSTNTHNAYLLCKIIYNKEESSYTLVDILTESKITNIVEKNAEKYNELLLKCGSTSSVHSASEKEKMTLLTSGVTEFVTNCTQMIQTCSQIAIVEAFQSLAKPSIDNLTKHKGSSKHQQKQYPNGSRHGHHHHQQPQHHHHHQQRHYGHHQQSHGAPVKHQQHQPRPYKQHVPDPPNYRSSY